MDAEKKLADIEQRLKMAEQKHRAIEEYRQELDKASTELKETTAAWRAGLELTKALENQVREKNERILQLEKDADFGRRFRELLLSINPPISTGASGKLSVEDPVAVVAVEDSLLPVKVDTTTVLGQIAKLIQEGVWPDKVKVSDARLLLVNNFNAGWNEDDIMSALRQMTGVGYRLFVRSLDSHKVQWFTLRPAGKERVHA